MKKSVITLALIALSSANVFAHGGGSMGGAGEPYDMCIVDGKEVGKMLLSRCVVKHGGKLQRDIEPQENKFASGGGTPVVPCDGVSGKPITQCKGKPGVFIPKDTKPSKFAGGTPVVPCDGETSKIITQCKGKPGVFEKA